MPEGSLSSRRHLQVEGLELRIDLVVAECSRSRPGGRAEPRAQRGVLSQPPHRARKGRRVARRHEQGLFTPGEGRRHGAHRGRDDRGPVGHRLEEGDRQSLGQRWQHEHVAVPELLVHRLRVEPPKPFNVRSAEESLRARRELARPGQGNSDPRVAGEDLGQSPEQCLSPLLRNPESADVQHPDEIRSLSRRLRFHESGSRDGVRQHDDVIDPETPVDRLRSRARHADDLVGEPESPPDKSRPYGSQGLRELLNLGSTDVQLKDHWPLQQASDRHADSLPVDAASRGDVYVDEAPAWSEAPTHQAGQGAQEDEQPVDRLGAAPGRYERQGMALRERGREDLPDNGGHTAPHGTHVEYLERLLARCRLSLFGIQRCVHAGAPVIWRRAARLGMC